MIRSLVKFGVLVAPFLLIEGADVPRPDRRLGISKGSSAATSPTSGGRTSPTDKKRATSPTTLGGKSNRSPADYSSRRQTKDSAYALGNAPLDSNGVPIPKLSNLTQTSGSDDNATDSSEQPNQPQKKGGSSPEQPAVALVEKSPSFKRQLNRLRGHHLGSRESTSTPNMLIQQYETDLKEVIPLKMQKGKDKERELWDNKTKNIDELRVIKEEREKLRLAAQQAHAAYEAYVKKTNQRYLLLEKEQQEIATIACARELDAISPKWRKKEEEEVQLIEAKLAIVKQERDNIADGINFGGRRGRAGRSGYSATATTDNSSDKEEKKVKGKAGSSTEVRL